MADNEIQTPQRDPTIATTEQLLREIKSAREYMEKALVGVQDVISARIVGMDRETDERFKSIAMQFNERDARVEHTSSQNKLAIDAALQAQKEAVLEQNRANALAVAKSEAAFTKQIDQIGALINAMSKSADERNDDLKNRVSKIETSSTGRINTIEGRAQGSGEAWGYLIGVVGAAAAAVSIFFALSTKP